MAKKYSAVYQPLIERLQAETAKKHKKGPDTIKAVKTKLHQLYGAYTQDNAHKKASAIVSALEKSYMHAEYINDDVKEPAAVTDLARNNEIQNAATALLSLHASTKERLPQYAEFYGFILSHVGQMESIIDIGCGYNPFSLPLIPEAVNLKAYYAYDIDMQVANLLNRFFSCFSLPPLAQCADLALHIPREHADVALMCKLIPVLEAQTPGSGLKLARELNASHLVITYPLKSLGGREKGMAQHYTAAFEKAMADGKLGKFALVGQRRIGDEMLYLLTR